MRRAPSDPGTPISSYVFIGSSFTIVAVAALESSVCAHVAQRSMPLHDRIANQCTGRRRPRARRCRKGAGARRGRILIIVA